MTAMLKAVTITVGLIVAVVGIAFLAFVSQFGDRSPTALITRNERPEVIVVFLCDDARPIQDCRGRRLPERSTVLDDLGEVGHGENAFEGQVIVTTEACEVLSRTKHTGSGDLVLVIAAQVELRTAASPYGERFHPGFEALEWSPRQVSCPLSRP